MPQPNIYEDIWVRWIHETWENRNNWRTDIRPSVLNNANVKKAEFILDDGSCVCVPMCDLNNILSDKTPEKNGSIIFSINPDSKTVEGKPVTMAIFRPKTNSAKQLLKKLLE